MPFEKGNKAAVGHTGPERIWAAAVRRACMRASSTKDKAQKLDKLAEKLIEEGLAGNTVALKEIGDRLDGKPAQTIQGDAERPLRARVELVIVDPTSAGTTKA